MNILYAPRAGKSSFNTVAAIAYFLKELKNEEEGGVIIPMDAYVVCSMCGHRLDSYGLHDTRWHNDYDMPLCRSCFQKLEEDKQHPIHKICEKRHRMFMDYIRYEYKKQEEKTMDYNKKKDTSINIKRNVTREEDMTINSISDLDIGDKIRIIIGGEVYEATVARRPASIYTGESYLDLVVDVFKPLSKSWKDLGYECFEDMIDDIAKEHGSSGTRYKCCGCLDAADSYGESYVEIEQNGAKTIVHSDSVTVYPVRKEEDKDNER